MRDGIKMQLVCVDKNSMFFKHNGLIGTAVQEYTNKDYRKEWLDLRRFYPDGSSIKSMLLNVRHLKSVN